jgi:hypothetical protein
MTTLVLSFWHKAIPTTFVQASRHFHYQRFCDAFLMTSSCEGLLLASLLDFNFGLLMYAPKVYHQVGASKNLEMLNYSFLEHTHQFDVRSFTSIRE